MIPVATLAHATRWQRLRSLFRFMFHRCRCRLLSTDEGIGGQCVTCGRIYGWMTREELGRAIRMPHIVPLPRIPGVDDYGVVHAAVRLATDGQDT